MDEEHSGRRLVEKMAKLARESSPPSAPPPQDPSLQRDIDRISQHSTLDPDELANRLKSERPFRPAPHPVRAYVDFIELGQQKAKAMRSTLEQPGNSIGNELGAICDNIIGLTDDAWIAKARANPSSPAVREQTEGLLEKFTQQVDAFNEAHVSLTEASLSGDTPPSSDFRTVNKAAIGFIVALHNAAARLPSIDQPGKGGAGR